MDTCSQKVAYENLYNAIIMQAVDDRVVAEYRHNEKVIRETDRFFNSKWFSGMTDVSKDSIYKAIQQRLESGKIFRRGNKNEK